MHCTKHQVPCGDVWSQTWNNQTFAQLAHQYGQSAAARFSDNVPPNGGLTDALKQKLAEEDLLDMEVLLRYRSIRTMRALESLETTERVVLLCKARELYELLGIFPSHLKNALNKLFGDVPQQGVANPDADALPKAQACAPPNAKPDAEVPTNAPTVAPPNAKPNADVPTNAMRPAGRSTHTKKASPAGSSTDRLCPHCSQKCSGTRGLASHLRLRGHRRHCKGGASGNKPMPPAPGIYSCSTSSTRDSRGISASASRPFDVPQMLQAV